MIPVYQNEIDAGIADIIKTEASIAFASTVQEVDLNEQKWLVDAISLQKTGALANPNQLDLFYVESVLVSIGWNKNDDVFDPLETWGARHTPVDKQFNFMHNEKDIIGHLTSAKVVDRFGKTIPDDTPDEDVPDAFDIIVGSVLYRSWSDQELQDRMNKIIEGIAKGEWFVSMECLFRNFDYAMVSPDNEHFVVARNEQTSSLSKHLRIYGGEGVFNGYKVGRLLRDFAFSGKGLVNNPANPGSVITSFDFNKEVTSFASTNAIDNISEISKETKIMSEHTYTQEQYDALKSELDALKAENRENEAKAKEATDKQLNELNEQVEALQKELDASKEVLAAKDEKIAGLETSLEESNAKLAEAEAKVEEIRLENVKAERKAQLLTKDIDEAKAVTLVEKFVGASDDMFEALLESFPAKKEEAECMKDGKEKDMKKKEKSKSEETEEAEEIAEAEESLESAEANEDEIDMAGDVEDEAKTLRTAASDWFASILESGSQDE
jgi:uncharacterized coiled-coil DUF342 family protein